MLLDTHLTALATRRRPVARKPAAKSAKSAKARAR
jgi:hypothetical protein